MSKALALAAAVALHVFALTVALVAQTTTMQPGTNTPLRGCIEGRALRVVNGFPACSTTVQPTLTNCGTAPYLSPNATDFVGQVTWSGLVSSCTMIMSKDYGVNFGCIAQSNSSLSLVTTPTVSSVGGKTQVVVPLSATLGAGKLTYTCFPV